MMKWLCRGMFVCLFLTLILFLIEITIGIFPDHWIFVPLGAAQMFLATILLLSIEEIA